MLFGAGGFLAQGRSPSPLIPILWSAAGIATPLLILIALYYRIAGFERSIPFAGLALLLAALNGFATETLGKRTPRPGLAASGALYATGTVAALALALTFALEKGWLTVALALMVPGIAWIANERPFPMLRWLAAAAVVLVVARVGWEPRIVGSDVGTTPIFNWILYGYGVPAISFWVAGHLLRKRADDQPCADGGKRRDPVHRADRVPRNPPFHERRRHLSPHQRARRARAAGLHRACDGDRARTRAPPHRQRRARHRRAGRSRR